MQRALAGSVGRVAQVVARGADDLLIRRVARERPHPDGDAGARDGHPDHDLRQLWPVILAVPVAAPAALDEHAAAHVNPGGVVAVSFGVRGPDGGYVPAFTLDNYATVLNRTDPFVTSLQIAAAGTVAFAGGPAFEVERRIDQADMRQRLRKISGLAAGLRIELLGQQSEIVGDRDHPVSRGYLCEKAQRLDHYQNGRGERILQLQNEERWPDGRSEPS